LSRRLDPIVFGHIDVHQYQIRLQRDGLRHGLIRGSSFTDHSPSDHTPIVATFGIEDAAAL